MGGYGSSYGVARVHAGESDVFYVPRAGGQGRRPIILCHGAGSTAVDFVQANPFGTLFCQLASQGFLLAATDLGGAATWGNATATARVDELRTYLGSTYGCATDKVALLGVSMGNVVALGYRRDYASRVVGIASIIGATDLDDIRVNNRGGLRASVDAAWNVVYPAALPAGANPAVNGPTLTGIGYRAYYSTGDTVVVPATVTAMATAMSGTAIIFSAADHGGTVPDIPTIDVAALTAVLRGWGC